MAFHTASFVTQTGKFQSGRHDHAVFLEDFGVVASGALNSGNLQSHDIIFDCTGLCSITTMEVNITLRAVAFGAASSHQAIIFFIPMAECFGLTVIMAGASPVRLNWYCTAQRGCAVGALLQRATRSLGH